MDHSGASAAVLGFHTICAPLHAAMVKLTTLLDRVNFYLPGRWQLLEFSDLWIIPSFIKHDLQDIATAQWTFRIPLLQNTTAAELAADGIREALDDLSNADAAQWSVIDFCSGQGGPIPTIETLVNCGRTSSGKATIPFQLSDLRPNLERWMHLASRSANLSFVPQPVDAANPAFSVISTTTAGDKEAAYEQGYESNGRKVYRLFCNAFHHFNDETAKTVLKSTLETSDAFSIIEIRERTILSMLLVVLETLILSFLAVLWFWKDGVHLFFTYGIPFLPISQLLDELISCLRCRTFYEVLKIVHDTGDFGTDGKTVIREGQVFKYGDWRFEQKRVLYLWPIGYMSLISGRKLSSSA